MKLRQLRRKVFWFFSNTRSSPAFHKDRARFLIILFVGFLALISTRALILHVFPAETLLTRIANNQYKSTINLSSFRGTVFDRRNTPLAISYKKPSIAVNPKVFAPTKKQANKLSKTLNISISKIQRIAKKSSFFSWLKRKASHKEWEQTKDMQIKGVYKITEPSRFYPQGSFAAHLLGFVGTDNTGLMGLEKVFENKIAGMSESAYRLKDARGQLIFLNSEAAHPEQMGFNHFLTIDHVIQEITEKTLYKWTKLSKSKKAFAIVLDPHTGRILAVANQPSFNPNQLHSLKIENTKNLAFTSLFEPGSVTKPMVMAKALELKTISLNEVHNCESSGRFKIAPKQWIHDDHPEGFLSSSQVIAKSSNICIFKIARKMGKERLWRSLKDFGFGETNSQLKFPGINPGRISIYKKWTEIRFANISFGQGFLVSGLEMVQAFSGFANGGNLVSPFVLDRIENDKGQIIYHTAPKTRRVLSPKTAKDMKEILSKVVTQGTAKRAISKIYSSAGKTGTAEKFDTKTKKYSANKRIANFIGFAPVIDPHILVYIVFDEPQVKPYYGGKWAAPAFKEIIEQTLKYLNVASKKVSAKL